MKINLPNERQATITIQIDNQRPKLKRPLPKQIQDKPFYATTIILTICKEGHHNTELTGTSYCNPLDHYELTTGLQKATQRLFDKNKQDKILTKDECRLIAPHLLLRNNQP